MGAEKDQKDFNKSILESGGALQFMTKETDSLHENLNILKDKNAIDLLVERIMNIKSNREFFNPQLL